ncbi:SCO6745 family protein [Sphaerisporangium aureirubrum]|uniref:SalK n=1 Tax=Sphaerisporangium aureirubrum TaxID=1544736 RepID=A0ABW1NPD0_9ACTN
MWHQIEPVHAVFWYSPEVFAEAAGLGLPVETRWPSYFAWRAAPLGEPGVARVASAFYSFSPRMVGEHVPDVWGVASGERVLAARERAVDRMYRALLGDGVGSAEVAEAAGLAREAALAAGHSGRPLSAANAGLPWPDEPHVALWHAIGILREHRGDGHIAALLTASLDPCEALVSFAAVGAAPVETFASRGWSEEEWGTARERLLSRGLITADGTATPAGHALRNDVERLTDDLAYAPWASLGPEKSERLAKLTTPILIAALESALLPATNTLGIGKIPPPTR